MTDHAPRLTPFARDQRPGIVNALVNDPEVREAAHAAVQSGTSTEAALARARVYAEEIVPQYSARLHHRLAHRFARGLATALFRVRVGYVDAAILKAIPADASVVFVINHRSNMDYVLVAFLAAEHVALSFAVGEWARIWPLDNLLRGLGAFFVRRDSRDRLYRKVLERYVQLAVEYGVTQGIFPEGGLSRDGRLRPPKLGLLSYATRHYSRATGRDLVFVPVGINYDRVLEDRNLTRELDPAGGAKPGKARTVASFVAWGMKNTGLYVRRRLHRFGYACVNFGAPLSLRGYLGERGLDLSTLAEDQRFAETEKLAAFLMEEIARVIPVTPVSLVATALLSFDDGGAARDALAERVTALVEELSAVGAHLYVPRRDADYFLEVGLRMLVLRRLVVDRGDRYQVVPAEQVIVRYYANAIAHFFATRDEASATRPVPLPSPNARAVILVHGLARTSRSMSRLGRVLEQAGYTVYNWDYPSRRYGVLALVDALDVFARSVAAASKQVDFVTHSMGGLLARGVLARGGFSGSGRLVMLAPPNQGAALATRVRDYKWARDFFGQALDDLSRQPEQGVADRLGSPSCEFGVIAGTRSFHPLQPTSYYSSLTQPKGTHDGTVRVEETQLPGMSDFVTVPANHMFIADHDEAIRQTLWFLEHGRFDRDRRTS